MASRSSESVSFERRDEENQLLREENARLRRVLAAHGIAVPQFSTRRCTAGSNDYADGRGKQRRARSQTDRALPEPVSRERRCLCAAMGEFRRTVRIFASGAEGLESHQFKQAGGSEEGRSEYTKVPPLERRGYRESSSRKRHYWHLPSTPGRDLLVSRRGFR